MIGCTAILVPLQLLFRLLYLLVQAGDGRLSPAVAVAEGQPVLEGTD